MTADNLKNVQAKAKRDNIAAVKADKAKADKAKRDSIAAAKAASRPAKKDTATAAPLKVTARFSHFLKAECALLSYI